MKIRVNMEENMRRAEKKIETAKRNIRNFMDFFKCPLCGSGFDLSEISGSGFLKCRDGHTYDISKKGYVNLFNGRTKITKTYDKNLFSARKTISDGGLYNPLIQKLCEIITNINPAAVLDAACGCGNLTVDIFANTGNPPTFAVDLSRDGIGFAAGCFCLDNLLWVIGNLNNLPFSDNKFDVILNIMSPANYAEFKRILKHDGFLIKVLPDSDYLKELRRFIYRGTDRNDYSNEDVLKHIEENVRITDIFDVRYTHTVGKPDIPALFDMTPLTLNIGNEEKTREQIKEDLIACIEDNNDFEITLAFKIAVCKR